MTNPTVQEIFLDRVILKTLTDNLPDMLWIKDLEGRYLFANEAICNGLLMAVDTLEPIGKTDVFFALREREKYADKPEWHTFGELCFDSDKVTIEKNRPMRFKEHGNVKGRLLHLEVHKAPFHDAEGNILGVVGSGRDITEMVLIRNQLEQRESELSYQANHDFLTDLPNRLLFQDRLDHILKKSARSGENVALFFIDLDRFKDINDIYGHDVGDQALQKISKRLLEGIREVDTLSRLGGDEFTLIIEDFKTIAALHTLADKLLRIINEPIRIGDIEHQFSASIGISLNLKGCSNSHSMLKHADSAMYQAKESGRNRFAFYSEDLTEKALKRVVMETELRTALREGQFEVYFQPKIHIGSDQYCGVECLVRWNHPSLGLLTPDSFIPCAEETGLIIELDRWVYKQSLAKLRQWKQQGIVENDFVMAMNLSPRQLEKPDFLPFFIQLLSENQIEPGLVELEVTENQVMTNLAENRSRLQAIEKAGIRLAIDDFGTGYSSLAYLKQLRFGTLKIDRSFISDVPTREEDTSIVLAILAMARTLGLNVVAEGVETKIQLEFLRKEHCDCAQGYYFSKPLCAADLELDLGKRVDRAVSC